MVSGITTRKGIISSSSNSKDRNVLIIGKSGNEGGLPIVHNLSQGGMWMQRQDLAERRSLACHIDYLSFFSPAVFGEVTIGGDECSVEHESWSPMQGHTIANLPEMSENHCAI